MSLIGYGFLHSIARELTRNHHEVIIQPEADVSHFPGYSPKTCRHHGNGPKVYHHDYDVPAIFCTQSITPDRVVPLQSGTVHRSEWRESHDHGSEGAY
ncbi:hypothetical protein N7467_005749 [Penicillium canescens]|nr:hypothetical protein N7467_005749 [Penicillium canescens]